MKGSQKVIDKLNELLTLEMTAVDLYFLYSRLFEDWGMTKLHAQYDHEKDDEGIHCDLLIKRIIFLEGQANVADRAGFSIKTNVKEILKQSLKYEEDVVSKTKEAIILCEKESDFATRETLLTILKDSEEDHIDWLETQLTIIENIGLERYIQTMSN